MFYDRLFNHHRYEQEAGDDSDSGGSGGADSGGGSDGGSDGGSTFGEFSGGGGTDEVTAENALISSEDVLKQGRELAISGIPLQVSSLYDALAKLRSTAAGSTAEILPQVMEQISSLRSQYSGASQAIARRLGFAGGGQVEREKQALLSKAGRQYGGLISKVQQAGFAGLINTTGNIQPALSGAARPPSVGIRTAPPPLPDYALQGQGIAALTSTAAQLQQYYANRPSADYAAQTIQGFRANPAFNPDAFEPIGALGTDYPL